MEIPVYVFSGFLDAGKTSFIQGTLEDERFNDGEKTLVLMCEDGEEELQREKFSSQNVFVEMIDEPEDLSAFLLSNLEKKHGVQRVIVEYNGMWPLGLLYQNLPQNWLVYQQYTFFDAATFIPYNTNMRQQVADKIVNAEMLVFNRTDDTIDREQIHRLIRALNRRCDILYEYADGTVEPDTQEDPLPFDVEADLIEISDRDYAIWYREVSEEPQKYINKTFKIKGMVVQAPELDEHSFICGRQLMTCCVEDMQFAGLICKFEQAEMLNTRDWVFATVTLRFEYHPVYGQEGPVLYVEDIAMTSEPQQPIATFY